MSLAHELGLWLVLHLEPRCGAEGDTPAHDMPRRMGNVGEPMTQPNGAGAAPPAPRRRWTASSSALCAAVAWLLAAFAPGLAAAQAPDDDEPLLGAAAQIKTSDQPVCFRAGGKDPRCVRQGDAFRECPKCPEMVVVPAGRFAMGSSKPEIATYIREHGGVGSSSFKEEGPRRQITIAQPFAVGKFEVTHDEWDACSADGECRTWAALKDEFTPESAQRVESWGRGKRPIVAISWQDAKTFVAWLSRKTGAPYRLLSEAEWEYAARAGTMTRFSWGNSVGRKNANCDGCGSQWDLKQPAPVGSFKPNSFGLYDMHGNVSELLEDCLNTSHHDVPRDGTARITGDCEYRMIRGGSWNYEPDQMRVAARNSVAPTNVSFLTGMRVARTLLP